MHHKMTIILFLLYAAAIQAATIYNPLEWFCDDINKYVQLYTYKGYKTNWHHELKAACANLDVTQHSLQEIQEKYSDEIALFRCRANTHSFIAIVWPVTKNYPAYKKIPKILNTYGTLRYKKQIILRNNAPLMLIKHAYNHESWLGNWRNNFYGIKSIKENICFPSYQSSHEIDVYLVEFENLSRALEAKYRIRKFFNLTFNSIHITDTHAEAISLAKIIFNKNSIEFLNNYQLVQMKRFEALLENNKKWLSAMMQDEAFCIIGKAIQAALGKHDCKSISFISKLEKPAPKGFYCKNSSLKKASTLDALAYDPQRYFIHNEIKFIL